MPQIRMTQLAAEGRTLSRLTKMFARSVVRVLGRHRERILDMELLHERIAGAAIELYAMAAVISKLQMTLNASGVNGNGNGNGHGNGHTHGNGHGHSRWTREMVIGRAFCHHAARRVRRHLHELVSNTDRQILDSADAALRCDDDAAAPTMAERGADH